MKTSVNLFNSLKTCSSRTRKHSPSKIVFLLILIAAITIVACFYVAALLKSNSISGDIQRITNHINTQSTINSIKEVDDKSEKLNNIQTYNSAVEQSNDSISSITDFSSEIYSKIVSIKPSYVTITGVSLKENTVSIQGISTINVPPADYAQNLDKLGIFKSVVYSGFTEGADGEFIFTVSCVLK